MALSKVDYNSLNVTAAASKALKWNSGADGFETGDIAGSMVLLETQTASSDSTITFDSNIDDTYKEYIFKFINVHPSNNGVALRVNFRDGSTAYDAVKTTTDFYAQHAEADGSTALAYSTGQDLAQSTAVQNLAPDIGNGNDECASGYLHLFAPSSTVFVKHFLTRTNQYHSADFSQDWFYAGYCNVTAAIDGVQFTPSAGTIDVGTFKMYGVK